MFNAHAIMTYYILSLTWSLSCRSCCWTCWNKKRLWYNHSL